MKRFGILNLALAMMLVLPAAASAQSETEQTREGTKLIALAMTRQTPEEKVELYREAMTHLRQGMEQDADNARVWLLAGTALAGMGDMEAADSAFNRAESLHPDYAEEIETERFDAWVNAFQLGLQAMENEELDEALRWMEGAEAIYTGRPEAQMYLGVLYANHTQDFEKASEAFKAALAATEGPLLETLDEEGQQEWIGMRESLNENIEQMEMSLGVTYFHEQRYEEAIESFDRLTELNPHSRDLWFNYSQALLARAHQFTDEIEDAEEAEAAAAKEQLFPVLDELQAAATRAQAMDPANEMLYLLLANVHRMRGEHDGSDEALEAGQQGALAALQAAEDLTVSIDEINVAATETGVQITGTLKNRKLDAGTPVRVTFTLLDRDGQEIGQETATVNAPAVDGEVQFDATTPVEDAVAGWRYTVDS